MLTPGQIVELSIEKAAAGGRMLARHDGQVVLVGGAVPGERVAARIERTERRLAFAAVTDIREASPDRREGYADPSCGGCVYSHIAYPRQLALKSDIVRDAFLRLGRVPLEEPIEVAPSPEREYRTRARFHVEGTRFGFYREGTHALCDAAATGQVADRALHVVRSVVARATDAGGDVRSLELAESIDGSQIALSLMVADIRTIPSAKVPSWPGESGAAGVVVHDERGRSLAAGSPWISDALTVLTANRVLTGELRHRPEAFFQANRFLVPTLVTAVLDAVEERGTVLDLYSGVGLFAAALAGSGRDEIVAVEGDPVSGADLEINARQPSLAAGAVSVHHDSVEKYLQRRSARAAAPGTVVVDPPRTGMTPEVIQSLVKLAPARLVYVSCDPPTMARDARRLLDGDYRLESLRAFDLFPNTPHVESLGVFVRAKS